MTEARILAKLRGSHTVSLIDFGVLDDGIVFIVMEYLEDSSSARRIRTIRLHGGHITLCSKFYVRLPRLMLQVLSIEILSQETRTHRPEKENV